jgi:membrane-associated protease RseP (regulator of RpoE activity)
LKVSRLRQKSWDRPDMKSLRKYETTEVNGLVIWKHLLLFLLTFVTATIAGSLYPFGPIQLFTGEEQSAGNAVPFWDYLHFPIDYFWFVVDVVKLISTNEEILSAGLKFSVSLLFILTAHEAGHYFACRFHKVRASLPYFLPAPPLLGPAGTLGAFIKIRSLIPSKRAAFDIGVAGPIAGFIALLPIAVLGILNTYETTSSTKTIIELKFSDPLLIRLLAWFFAVNLESADLIKMNSYYAAAWLGLLITALNLLPSGQLDGGHAVYALFGKKIHKFASLASFAIMSFLAIIGFYFYNSPASFLFAILLGLMMYVPHPAPADETPLDLKRKITSFLVLLIFILSFVPFPIHVVE